jgi:beta-lactam-binding protein with PASTA domain
MSEFRGKRVLAALKDFGAFLITKAFLKHLGLSVLVILVLLFVVFQSLNVITHHGEGLSVPDFTGKTLKQAIADAKAIDLKIEVNDSVYNAPGKKGTIIRQNPSPDFKVKKGRTIHVQIKAFNPERIKMPDFTGVSLIQAKADIETYGLKIGKLQYVPDIATNNVLEQMYNGRPIAPGTVIEKDSRIDLVLGMGESNEVTIVPDLKGFTRSDALQKATDHSLNIGAMVFDETVITTEDSTMAKVWKQTPIKNYQTTMGSLIDLWLTLDTEKLQTNNDDNLQ